MREGRGIGEVGAVSPPPPLFSTSQNLLQLVHDEKPGSESRAFSYEVPQPTPQLEEPLPAVRSAAPRSELRLWWPSPRRSPSRASAAGPVPGRSPSLPTFSPGGRSTRQQKRGQHARRPCWAAEGVVPGCSDLPRALLLGRSCADPRLPSHLVTGAVRLLRASAAPGEGREPGPSTAVLRRSGVVNRPVPPTA